MSRVLLVLCNSPMDNLIPVGVSLLSSYLKKAGHEVKLFDTTFYLTGDMTGDEARSDILQLKPMDLRDFGIPAKTDMDKDFLDCYREFEPDIVGASVIEMTYYTGVRLLDLIKDEDVVRIMGGVFVGMAADLVLSNDCVDCVCVGEGEGAIVDLADAVGREEDWSEIKNLM